MRARAHTHTHTHTLSLTLAHTYTLTHRESYQTNDTQADVILPCNNRIPSSAPMRPNKGFPQSLPAEVFVTHSHFHPLDPLFHHEL